MMKTIANILGPQGGLLIGIDLHKDSKILEAAYNDCQGVTDQFNLNVLHRINDELEADFDVEHFSHQAVYNVEQGRVEIYIVSERDQVVTVFDRRFEFSAGERILTEYSHKYTIDGFVELASQAGFSLHKHWTDERELFAVLHLVMEDD